ncbi:MAG: D-tyrosyl-tRNA(Tyr) deacylase [Candidatus Kapabacteria bacterium]|nr:D-tyrosyl-tRNA(Tyr) deacylase [Candidatus Kapabacteria bacterium]
MRIVVQRVKYASVHSGGELVASIEQGLLVLLGITHTDTLQQADWLAHKIAKLRIFPDDDDKMNRSVSDIDGSVLVVSQFTLYGDAKKGLRPSFIDAAHPNHAEPLYTYFCEQLRNTYSLQVQTGIFGAMMDVSLVNWGPVTLILDNDSHIAP